MLNVIVISPLQQAEEDAIILQIKAKGLADSIKYLSSVIVDESSFKAAKLLIVERHLMISKSNHSEVDESIDSDKKLQQ